MSRHCPRCDNHCKKTKVVVTKEQNINGRRDKKLSSSRDAFLRLSCLLLLQHGSFLRVSLGALIRDNLCSHDTATRNNFASVPTCREERKLSFFSLFRWIRLCMTSRSKKYIRRNKLTLSSEANQMGSGKQRKSKYQVGRGKNEEMLLFFSPKVVHMVPLIIPTPKWCRKNERGYQGGGGRGEREIAHTRQCKSQLNNVNAVLH